jgi:hypothetical protein|nr:hypothetical protein [Acetobacter pasteurianus]
MTVVFGLIGQAGNYPDQLDPTLGPEFAAIIAQWRPALADHNQMTMR